MGKQITVDELEEQTDDWKIIDILSQRQASDRTRAENWVIIAAEKWTERADPKQMIVNWVPNCFHDKRAHVRTSAEVNRI